MSIVEVALALDGDQAVASALNANGMPLQYCCTWQNGKMDRRVLADPATDRTDAASRIVRARCALAEVFALANAEGLLPGAQRLFDAANRDAEHARDGACWLAASLDGPGAALYVDARAGAEVASRAGVGALARLVLSDCAAFEALLDALPPGAQPLCAGLEGTDELHARFKLYWRFAQIVPLGELGDPLFGDPAFAAFARTVVGDRSMLASGIVASAGFALSGERVDVKVDLCACVDCASRSTAQWRSLLAQLGDSFDIAMNGMDDALSLGVPSYVGFGLGRDGTGRLNLYLRPERLAA